MVDSLTQKVIHIDFPPTYKAKGPENSNEHLDFTPAGKTVVLHAPTTVPPLLSNPQVPNRDRLPPPKAPQDFLPDLIEKSLSLGFKILKLLCGISVV